MTDPRQPALRFPHWWPWVAVAVGLGALAWGYASSGHLLSIANGVLSSAGVGGRPVAELVVHHTASPSAYGDKRVDMALIARWHRRRGLGAGFGDARDSAYHFLILPDGGVQAGRPLDRPGASTRSADVNRSSIAVALVGDFERRGEDGRVARPTRAQLAALNELSLWACRRYGFGPDSVRGHREVTRDSACPGRRMDMEALRARLTSSIEAGGAGVEPPRADASRSGEGGRP